MTSAKFLLCIFAALLSAIQAAPQAAQSQSQPQTQSQSSIPSTDIFLSELTAEKGAVTIGKPVNITHRNGYDNQPFFLPDQNGILYTMIDPSGQADIFRYDMKIRSTQRITATNESEYSPTVTPDGKHISVVRVEADNTQRLWQFPIAGGIPELLLKDVKPVGYHAWIDSNSVLVYVLGEPATLQRADLRTGKASVVATNIGRCLQRKPGTGEITFVQIVKEDQAYIKMYAVKTGIISDLIPAVRGSEDYAWLPDGGLLMGHESKVFFARPGKDAEWKETADLSKYGIHAISRLAVSRSGRQIAIVAEE